MNDNVLHNVMGWLCAKVAEFWAEHMRPVSYGRVFYPGGVRVKVTVELYERPDDTQPVRAVRDEDEGIAD